MLLLYYACLCNLQIMYIKKGRQINRQVLCVVEATFKCNLMADGS